MDRFRSAGALCSWAKVWPGNNVSAGKQRRIRKRHQKSPYVRAILFQVAKSAVRTKGSYSSAQYRRIRARRGPTIAYEAVAHSILEAIYHMMREGTRYRELGEDFFDWLREQTVVRNSLRRLRKLGYNVTIERAA